MSIDLTLDRIQRLALHLPPYTRPTCHISGTNGKGSVSSILSSILHHSSPPSSVGRFNSPHLVSVNDCITINDQPVTSAVYASAREEVDKADRDHGIGASNFELLTLTALFIFERARVDIVVLEVGMGGRLDATNVISDDCVAISALTAVDLDHQAFLGDSVSAIAAEKSGIARKGKPFVLGPQTHPEVVDVVRDRVALVGGDVVRAISATLRQWDEIIDGPVPPAFSLTPASFCEPSPQPVTVPMPCFSEPVHALLPLYGEHQLDNLGVACTVVSTLLDHPACVGLNLRERITPVSVARGIRSVSWPGRLSFHVLKLPPTKLGAIHPMVVLADGAHNPASARTLSKYITHLLSIYSPPTATSIHPLRRSISLTYILALSDSPPKTPLQTLSSLLPPILVRNSNLRVNVNVAALRFTPPDDMPWVKSVPPSELRDVVRDICPEADLWDPEDDKDASLGSALDWAASKNREVVYKGGEGLVIVAGSLYLVADFYRFRKVVDREDWFVMLV